MFPYFFWDSLCLYRLYSSSVMETPHPPLSQGFFLYLDLYPGKEVPILSPESPLPWWYRVAYHLCKYLPDVTFWLTLREGTIWPPPWYLSKVYDDRRHVTSSDSPLYHVSLVLDKEEVLERPQEAVVRLVKRPIVPSL